MFFQHGAALGIWDENGEFGKNGGVMWSWVPRMLEWIVKKDNNIIASKL